MKKTKEIQTILSVLYYYNFLSPNKNKDIEKLLDYAFDRILDSPTRLLTLACMGRTLENSREEINEILKKETKYFEYIQRMEAIRRKK